MLMAPTKKWGRKLRVELQVFETPLVASVARCLPGVRCQVCAVEVCGVCPVFAAPCESCVLCFTGCVFARVPTMLLQGGQQTTCPGEHVGLKPGDHSKALEYGSLIVRARRAQAIKKKQ